MSGRQPPLSLARFTCTARLSGGVNAALPLYVQQEPEDIPHPFREEGQELHFASRRPGARAAHFGLPPASFPQKDNGPTDDGGLHLREQFVPRSIPFSADSSAVASLQVDWWVTSVD